MLKSRYKVDLSRQLAECEANYWRLSKLMPEGGADESCQFAVASGGRQWVTGMEVIERSRYTTTLRLRQSGGALPGDEWLRAPELTVRLYHDAQLAEVLAWERHRRLQPRYEYPNRLMYHQDEKAQLNRFLGEWLGLCLKKGHSLEKVW